MKPSLRPSALRDTERPGGFVLVGVVIFILALTILGLSVFSLSSYEAQFLRGSMVEQNVYDDALSGLERAKYILLKSDSLQSVRFYLPPGIDSTLALQRQGGVMVRTGEMRSDTVWLSVWARHGTTSRCLSAAFMPHSNESYYKRTMHSATGVFVDVRSSTGILDRDHTVGIPDAVRQVSTDFSWIARLFGGMPPSDSRSQSIPFPDVASYMAAHMPGATQVPYTTGPNRYTLSNPDPNHVKYFMWPDSVGKPSPASQWTRFDIPGAEIVVDGMVVWMLPAGLHFGNTAVVRRPGGHGGHSDDCLIIVTGPGGYPEPNLGGMYVGIEFGGGIDSPDDVPVILVSSGAVNLDQENADNQGWTLDYCSVFAGGIYIRGPKSASGRVTKYLHDVGADEDKPGHLIDKLLSLGALPNSTGGPGAKLDLLAGTWQDRTP